MTILELLIEKGYSKLDAEKWIRAGYVKVDGIEVLIPGNKVKESATLSIKKQKEWVSRGALKLLYAIEEFSIDFQDKTVLDIGSSTGGFTEVALKKGANKIYALDVGTNQLDFSLRRNDKVISLEKTNLKNIKKTMFSEDIDIVVTDVSFISLKEVFKVLELILKKGIKVMALIKPQYEAFIDEVSEKGYVKEELHPAIIKKVIEHASKHNFKYIDSKRSIIKGLKSSNIEYISFFEKG